ncbi:phage protein [Candidatus Thiothrix sp. Deng01]|uniref:Phage protein n=1 Tax=Candidatus Thiothrix phosphatis TaxID=3112415 RepID=A0ABU6D3T5_9GAMM|nr:phage protein [Candidatus Thiothrix sp. Deng01]MEB4592984.1 phage protein [Candidatus Thiothrix sp. Deng01]
MSTKRISGKDVRLYVGGVMLFAEKFELKIDDKRAVALTNGVPNGWVDGETTASGSITLDSSNFDMLLQGVGGASWKDIAPQDIQAFASAGGLAKDVSAHGCLLRLSDLWSSESKGGEKMTHTVEYDVTSPDFVSIDGIPYLTAAETAGFY